MIRSFHDRDTERLARREVVRRWGPDVRREWRESDAYDVELVDYH